jgi:hypothetical protein
MSLGGVSEWVTFPYGRLQNAFRRQTKNGG